MLTSSDVDAAIEEQGLHWAHEGDELTTTVKLHDFAAALELGLLTGEEFDGAVRPEDMTHP